MTTYTFEDSNILKSRVLDSSYSETILYTSTTSGILHRKATVISNAARKPLATIHWNSKTFEMGGTTRTTKSMKSKPGSFFDRTWQRTWRWDPSTPEYSIEYKDHKWTATQSATGNVCAVFNSYRVHVSRKSEPASMTFTKGLPDMEQLFLVMVLLRMEGRRLDTEDNQARGNAVSEAVTQGSGNGTTKSA